MASGVRITGLDDALRCYEAAGTNMTKMCQKALRKASAQTSKDIKAGLPKDYRSLVKYKIKKLRDGQLRARLGLYNGEGAPKGREIPKWFKAYWANYGTLTKRDTEHKFDQPVKPVRFVQGKRGRRVANRRNSIGQVPQRFFENSLQGFEAKFLKNFERQLTLNNDELYKR